MIARAPRHALLRLFSSALASQAVLSATNFLVGLALIRHADEHAYAAYVLVLGAIALAVSLQNAFIAPALANRMAVLDAQACSAYTGGLHREQADLIARLAAGAIGLVLLGWATGVLLPGAAILCGAGIVATAATLRREYFRMVLLAHRRSHEVLRGDLLYALLLAMGVALATVAPAPALGATLALALAAGCAGARLSRTLQACEPWNPVGTPGVLREIAAQGVWSSAGAAIHWSFSHGYVYLVAAVLDLRAVAAIAATRLLAMPVNLLSVGIGSLLLPVTARWLQSMAVRAVWRRLTGIALSLAAVAACYFALLWFARDWVFDVVLRRDFAQRELLLLLWTGGMVLMVVHQQWLHLLAARMRFRPLSALALLSAGVALGFGFLAMPTLHAAGAALGLLLGEVVNVCGVGLLCLREIAASRAQLRGEQQPHSPSIATRS